MKKFISCAVALCLMLISCVASAEGVLLTVSGAASVSADPDIVTISTEVSAKETSILAAQQQMSTIVTTVLDELQALGIDKEDIITTGYYCYPNYDYSSETVKVDGYQARHTLEITCRDLELLDKVVSVLSHAGVNEINNISYDKADKTELYSQALALAVAAAQAKADTLAAAVGAQKATIQKISESNYGVAIYARSKANGVTEEAMSDYGSNIATQINSGSVTINATVEAVFEAK